MLIEGDRNSALVEKGNAPVSASGMGSSVDPTSGSGLAVPSGSSQICSGLSSSGGSESFSDPAIASLVSGIRDMLPDYGAGFLMACLAHYDMKPDQVRSTFTH